MTVSDEVRARLQARSAQPPAPEPVRLPARRFVDRAFYEAERAEIFGKAWLLAGRVDEIARPGLYMTWEKTRVPLLVVHAVDDVIRCFYNSCRHRGAPVVRVPRGRNRALRCQYHSWTYDTSGKLVSVPDERDFVDLRREERALVPVSCEVRNSAIFVNEGPEADLGSWFGGPGKELTVESEGLRTLDQQSVTIPVNWKRVMGRLLSSPPALPRPGAGDLATTDADVELLDGGHLRIVAPFDAAGASALGLAGPLDWADLSDADLPPVHGLGPMLSSTATTYLFFPNLLVSYTPSGIFNFAVWPADEETTLLEATWLAPDWGEEDSPAETPAWAERIEWAQAQLDAAAAALAGAQDEMKEPARQGLSLQDDSEAVRLWNEALDAHLGGVVPPDTLTGAAPGEVRSPLPS
ncbi:MAG: Rieske 2Fe-2S domain-containing protein [Chloroflexota bacterium]|nr:Rieske 2Fe-2S domain-containing protein [Chloroflexota bacterium]